MKTEAGPILNSETRSRLIESSVVSTLKARTLDFITISNPLSSCNEVPQWNAYLRAALLTQQDMSDTSHVVEVVRHHSHAHRCTTASEKVDVADTEAKSTEESSVQEGKGSTSTIPRTGRSSKHSSTEEGDAAAKHNEKDGTEEKRSLQQDGDEGKNEEKDNTDGSKEEKDAVAEDGEEKKGSPIRRTSKEKPLSSLRRQLLPGASAGETAKRIDKSICSITTH